MGRANSVAGRMSGVGMSGPVRGLSVRKGSASERDDWPPVVPEKRELFLIFSSSDYLG